MIIITRKGVTYCIVCRLDYLFKIWWSNICDKGETRLQNYIDMQTNWSIHLLFSSQKSSMGMVYNCTCIQCHKRVRLQIRTFDLKMKIYRVWCALFSAHLIASKSFMSQNLSWAGDLLVTLHRDSSVQFQVAVGILETGSDATKVYSSDEIRIY